MRIEIHTTSEQETIGLGEALGRTLEPGDIVALHGDLGAGKTRFVKGIASALGVNPSIVSSPTFVIMQEYAAANAGAVRVLAHIDAYRLSGPDELESIGWDRIVSDASAVAVVEWAERINAALPMGNRRMDVRITHADPGAEIGGASGKRSIIIEAPTAWRTRAGWANVESRSGAPRVPARPPTHCPVTGKPVPPDSPTYPFFDEKARLADLGRWFSGSYSISRDIDPDDSVEPG